MTATRPSRSTRDRPAKAPLSEQAIVEAALGILAADGLDAVSMRRVAAAVDTGAGSLYVYFANRDALLRAMFDRVIATIELEAPKPKRWRPQLHSLLERLRDTLIAHPGMAAALMIYLPTTRAALRLLENMLGLLLAAGLDAQTAAWTADILSAQVTYAAIETEARNMDIDKLVDEVTADLAQLPPVEYPLITAHVAELTAGDENQRFRFGIDALLDGVLVRNGAGGG